MRECDGCLYVCMCVRVYACVCVKGASKSEKAPNGSTYLECADSEEIKKLLK